MDVIEISKIKKITHEDFVKRVFDLVGDEYEVCSEYLSSKKYIEMKHNICNHVWRLKPSDFVGRLNRKGSRCPKCNIWKGKNTEQFKKEVYDVVGEEYKVIGNYINTHSKIKMMHKCGNIYEPTAHNFLAGARCPICKIDTTENKIRSLLSSMGIKFETQYRNSKCKNKLTLPFDFKIINSAKNILIEFDGEQHFRPVDFSGKNYDRAKENLIMTQINDNIKNSYCIKENIPLIRIPYWEKGNIEHVLENVLYYFNIHKLNKEIDKELVKRYFVDSNWDQNTYSSWQYEENRYWLNGNNIN